MNAQELAKLVIDGAENFETLKETIDILVKERVARKADAKVEAKAAREKEQNDKALIGKDYFATLKKEIQSLGQWQTEQLLKVLLENRKKEQRLLTLSRTKLQKERKQMLMFLSTKSMFLLTSQHKK